VPNDNLQILLNEQLVKGKIRSMNSACSATNLADFHLKSCIEGEDFKITLPVNYHQFILESNNVLFLNIANITLMSLWAVASTAFL